MYRKKLLFFIILLFFINSFCSAEESSFSDNIIPPASAYWKNYLTDHFIIYYIPINRDVVHGSCEEEIVSEGRCLEESYYDAISLGFSLDENYLAGHNFEPSIISILQKVYKNKIHVYVFNFAKENIFAYTGSIGDPKKPGETIGSYIYLNNEPYSYISRNSPVYLSLMKTTLNHEYFHVIQNTYNVLEDFWWSEATAEWFAERKDPELIREKLGRLLCEPDKSLDNTEDIDRPYDASIFPLYLEQLDKDLIKDIWKNCMTLQSYDAIDKALSDRGGVKKVFEDFALENLIQKMPFYHISGKPDIEVKKEKINLLAGENIIQGNIEHLSARYYTFTCAGNVTIKKIEGINRENGGLFLVKNLKNGKPEVINIFTTTGLSVENPSVENPSLLVVVT